jgi:hypothetical protein
LRTRAAGAEYLSRAYVASPNFAERAAFFGKGRFTFSAVDDDDT